MSNSKSPTKAGAPYLAFFWRDVGGMYQTQRAQVRVAQNAFSYGKKDKSKP
jgi:hypothetical protein